MFGKLSHPYQADTIIKGPLRGVGNSKSYTIIANFQAQFALSLFHFKPRFCRPGVSCLVVERLLNNAINMDGFFLRKPAACRRIAKVDWDPRLTGRLVCEPS
jgi:hypothetical protein